MADYRSAALKIVGYVVEHPYFAVRAVNGQEIAEGISTHIDELAKADQLLGLQTHF